jgi:hypothetical protein
MHHTLALQVHKVDIVPLGLNPLSAVSSGRIVASAPIVEGVIRLVPSKDKPAESLELIFEVGGVLFRAVSDVRQWEHGTKWWQAMKESDRLKNGATAICAQVVKCTELEDAAWVHESWLVLQATSESGNEWGRIGMIRIPEHQGPYFRFQAPGDTIAQQAQSKLLAIV